MKSFKPTSQMLETTAEVVKLKALVATIKPIVEAIQQKEIDMMVLSLLTQNKIII